MYADYSNGEKITFQIYTYSIYPISMSMIIYK